MKILPMNLEVVTGHPQEATVLRVAYMTAGVSVIRACHKNNRIGPVGFVFGKKRAKVLIEALMELLIAAEASGDRVDDQDYDDATR